MASDYSDCGAWTAQVAELRLSRPGSPLRVMSKRPPVRSNSKPSNANEEAVERAILALRMQRPAEAERVAAEVLKANRGNLRAAQVLGQALLMQNRAAEAIEPLERAARRGEAPDIETLLATALAAAGR